MSVLTLLAGLVVIVAAIVAILRKVDVRLALLLAALGVTFRRSVRQTDGDRAGFPQDVQ